MIAALALAAAVSAAPSPVEMQALLAAVLPAPSPVRAIRCQVLGDPTEHRCTWRQKSHSGAWETWSAILAQDGGRWILIDRPSRASHP